MQLEAFPEIVTAEHWDAARHELLVKEKQLTRARDALAAERRRMPRMAVEKDYAFEGPGGPASRARLADGAHASPAGAREMTGWTRPRTA